MNRDAPTAVGPDAGTMPERALTQRFAPGLALTAVVFCVYGGIAVSVDFPRAAFGIQSDEATYYMMGHSLVEDGDLTYRREDLARVWREFPGGPTGVFLKRGKDIVDAGLMLRPPFVWLTTGPDRNPNRLFYGKSFIYPVFASPFVWMFGTNGFLVLNAVLLAAVVFAGYAFLLPHTRPVIAALLAGGFVLATVVPVYFVWITPELFNFATAFLAYFCWLYKEVATPSVTGPRPRWLFRGSSDVGAAVLLGIATFSKVSNALLLPPIVLWQIWCRRFRRALVTSAVYLVVAAFLFGINMAISGEWNYQGGDRSTYYSEFPFQTPESGTAAGAPKARDEPLWDVLFGEDFWTHLRHNLKWYFVGRYSGLVAYFFPAVFALVLFGAALRRRPVWQHLVLAAGIAQILFFIITLPYTWFGGGGSVGNRYFVGAYGVFFFLLPPVSRLSLALVPWAVGGLFTAKLVLNPFVASFYPGTYADFGPLRLLPVELSNVNDLPINTDPSRVRIWFGDNPGQNDPGFQIYFLDRNAYGREEDKSFWVKGDSRAEFLIKSDRRLTRLVLTLSAGPVPTRVRAAVAGRSQDTVIPAGASLKLVFVLPPGYPYEGRQVWEVSVSSRGGFVPMFHGDPGDVRYLGVRVKPTVSD